MGIYRIQRLSYKTNNTHHTKKRYHQLLGVNWLKQLPITINKILLDEPTNQSKTIHTKYNNLFETNHAIKNAVVKSR